MPGSGSLSLSIVRLSPLNVDVCVYNTRGLYRRRAARYNLPRGVYARSRRDAEFSSAARLIYRDGALYVCVCVYVFRSCRGSNAGFYRGRSSCAYSSGW